MTERRPAHETVPDFVERQIREAQARGAFDELAGHGRPLPGLDQPHDELWWVKRKLREENVADLPPALRARAERDRAVVTAMEAADEQSARRTMEDVNELIRRINRTTVHGPPTSVGPVDVDELVARWRAGPAGVAAARREREGERQVAVGGDVPRPSSWRRAIARLMRRVRRG